MTPADDPADPIARARQLESSDEARALYDEWAERYDHDVFEVAGVTGSRRIADLLVSRLDDLSVPILDLGCGTGVLGRHLAEAGCSNITGVDLSPGMLAAADRTGAYVRLVEADLTQPIDDIGQFGATVSAGTFTSGHVNADSVPHLLALHRPGASIAWTISPASWAEFEEALQHGGVAIVSSTLEHIRRSGDDRSHMVIGSTSSPTGS